MLEQSILVALVIGLTEVTKETFKLKSRYVPAVAVGWGIILSFAGGFFGWISATLISGITAGLTAIGLYSGTKNTLNK